MDIKRQKPNKTFFYVGLIALVILLLVISGYFALGRQSYKPIKKMTVTKKVVKPVVSAPKKIKLPSDQKKITQKTMDRLSAFQTFVVNEIAKDKTLTHSQKNAFLDYAETLDEVIKSSQDDLNNNVTLTQLSGKLHVLALQSQIAELQKKLSSATLVIKKNEFEANKYNPVQKVKVPKEMVAINKAPKLTIDQLVQLVMTYGDFSHLSATLLIKGEREDVNIGDQLLGKQWKVVQIQPNYITLLSLKTGKKHTCFIDNNLG